MSYNVDDMEDEIEKPNEEIDLEAIPDIDDGGAQEYDYEANAFETSAPPVPGVFPFRMEFQENTPVSRKESDKGKPYFSVPLIFSTITDNEVEKGYIYKTFSTLVNEKKKTSTVITLLKAAGVELPTGSIKQSDQLRLLNKLIKSEQPFWLRTDWEVTYNSGKKRKARNGKEYDDYRTLYKSYNSVPKDPNDPTKKQYKFKKKLENGDEVECSARLIAVDYLGKTKEGIKGKKVAGKPVTSSLPPKNSVVNSNATVEDLEKELG